jgi:hypothetical protein
LPLRQPFGLMEGPVCTPRKGQDVKAGVLIGVGALVALTGLIWALQGFNLIGGSFMSGDSVWAIVGPITACIGLALAGIGIRMLRTR